MHKEKLTLGQKAADIITGIVSSWYFVAGVLIYILLWISLNTYLLVFGQWDAYPFIILNLTLSSLAALHASIILMSHNRKAESDAKKIQYDYLIDKKTEKELKQVQLDIIQIKKAVLKENSEDRSKKLVHELKKVEEEILEMERKMIPKY